MLKKNEIQIKILSLLNDLSIPERIEVIERIGKRLRQANSIQSAKEVQDFINKSGSRKNIDYTPILKKGGTKEK